MSVSEVIDYLLENGPATRKEIEEELGKASSTIRTNLNKMKQWDDYYDFREIEGSEHLERKKYDAEKKN